MVIANFPLASESNDGLLSSGDFTKLETVVTSPLSEDLDGGGFNITNVPIYSGAIQVDGGDVAIGSTYLVTIDQFGNICDSTAGISTRKTVINVPLRQCFDVDGNVRFDWSGDKPEVPAIATPQNIVDALVALGLVTQAT